MPQYFRVVRNQTASVKAELFVEAAQSLGAGPVWIMRKYLFRNVITSVPVVLTMNAADSVLMLGSLGFLGLGLPAVVPEWGAELKQALTACPLEFGGRRSTQGWRCSSWCWRFPSLAKALMPGSAAMKPGPEAPAAAGFC